MPTKGKSLNLLLRLKRSPFADRNALPVIEAVIAEQAERDADRAEFAQLFAKAKPLLTTAP